jgi:hypothetical protein
LYFPGTLWNYARKDRSSKIVLILELKKAALSCVAFFICSKLTNKLIFFFDKKAAQKIMSEIG